MAADQLGLHPDQVKVRQGDTDLAPFGWGTFASRSAVIGGGSVMLASGRLAQRLREIAGHLLEAAPEDVELRAGRAGVRGAPDAGLAIAELARVAHFQSHRLPAGMDPGLEAGGSYDPPGTFSNATHAALVEVDAETAGVAVLGYLVVEDCGVVINPMVVEGQVRGGVAQGIAAALLEQLHYDETGQLLGASLMDYMVPTAGEIPPMEVLHLQTRSEHSLTGAKGMGEGGTIGAPAAIVNAVNDALAHTGVELDSLPVRPEQILAALDAAGGGGGRP